VYIRATLRSQRDIMKKPSKPVKVRFNGMEKEIQIFADENCEGNFNQAVRMLCKTSLINR